MCTIRYSVGEHPLALVVKVTCSPTVAFLYGDAAVEAPVHHGDALTLTVKELYAWYEIAEP